MVPIRHLGVALFLLLALGGDLRLPVYSYNEPCNIYGTDTEEWRNPATPEGDNCDKKLYQGWYTFLHRRTAAQIPTSCLQENTCGTKIPFHVDLKGQSMPGPGETINASLCGSARVLDTIECCVFRQDILIKHCQAPTAFIYYLQPIPHCPGAICTTTVKEGEPDREYRFEPGDVPLSLQTTNTTTTTPTTTTTTTTPSTTSTIITTTTTTPFVSDTITTTTTTPESSNETSPSVVVDSTLDLFSSSNATDDTPQENSTVAAESTTLSFTASSTNEMVHVTTSVSTTPLPEHKGGFNLVAYAQGAKDKDKMALQSSLEPLINRTTGRVDRRKSRATPAVTVSSCGPGVLNAFIPTFGSAADGDCDSSEEVLQELFSKAINHVPSNVELLAACCGQGRCLTSGRALPPKSHQKGSVAPTCFTNLLLIILIIIVVVLSVILLIVGTVRLCKRWSKRGTWRPPPDQMKDDEELGSDSGKPADLANGGGTAPANNTTTTTTNGPEEVAVGKINDDGFEVVPLDQAPGTEQACCPGEDLKAENTRM